MDKIASIAKIFKKAAFVPSYNGSSGGSSSFSSQGPWAKPSGPNDAGITQPMDNPGQIPGSPNNVTDANKMPENPQPSQNQNFTTNRFTSPVR